MTPERFRTLLEAHGADFRRWPQAEQEAARALAAQEASGLRPALAEAQRLDALLDGLTVAPPDAALIQRIAATAPVAAPLPHTRPHPRLSWLWRGAGLAGIGLAGSLAGAFAVSLALRGSAPPPGLDWPERASAFTEASPDWSTE